MRIYFAKTSIRFRQILVSTNKLYKPTNYENVLVLCASSAHSLLLFVKSKCNLFLHIVIMYVNMNSNNKNNNKHIAVVILIIISNNL